MEPRNAAKMPPVCGFINNNNNNNCKINNIKSTYILKIILSFNQNNKILNLIRYNKKLQKKLKYDIDDYANNSETKIIAFFSKNNMEPLMEKDYNDKYVTRKSNYFVSYYYNNHKKEDEINKNEIIEKVIIKIKNEMLDLDYFFAHENNIVGIRFAKANANIRNMEGMFEGCSKLKVIQFLHFSAKNVTNMARMFNYCKKLKIIYWSRFNTKNVTDMSEMFHGCSSLKELNLNNFKTDNVTNMKEMFSGCSSLEELNLNNFNTSKVTNMMNMFSECSSLKELNINSFNTGKVTNMMGMFSECSSLKDLNLNNFNTNNVTEMGGMFYGCSDELITKIKIHYKNIKEEAFEEI